MKSGNQLIGGTAIKGIAYGNRREIFFTTAPGVAFIRVKQCYIIVLFQEAVSL